jgi:hypothetical protein
VNPYPVPIGGYDRPYQRLEEALERIAELTDMGEPEHWTPMRMLAAQVHEIATQALAKDAKAS